MGKVKIEDIVDHFSTEFKRALKATIEEHFPGQDFDTAEIYTTFKNQVY